jgi:ribokinase
MAVCVLGSLNLDDVALLPERVAWGQTLLARASRVELGGKGLNQAVASARSGSMTRMIGAVGLDDAGRDLIAFLADTGVATDDVARIDDEVSGRAIILIAPDGENMIAVIGGANSRVDAAQVARANLDGASVFLAQLETDIDAIAELFAMPEAQAGRKILNTAPAVPEARRLFGVADILIFNQTEFAAYLDLDFEPETLAEAQVARRILTRPDQIAVVTLGRHGSAAIWADRELFVPAFPVANTIDTSGAGDCFCGALAAAIDQGIGFDRALTFANAAAALSVQAPGAAPSMPMRSDVDRAIAAAGR